MPRRRMSWLVLLLSVAVVMAMTMDSAVRSSEDEYMAGYTGADAELSGSDMCAMCHSDMVPTTLLAHAALIDTNTSNPDYGYGCEGCHGPGGNHMGDAAGILYPPMMTAEGVTELCTKCHSSLRSFDAGGWMLSEHYFADMSCLACHSGHSEFNYFLVQDSKLEICYSCHAEKYAEFNMRSHHPVEEGQLGCESCHNVHSGMYEGQLNNDGDMLCFECHTDKQGPFIYNHDVSMASGNDGCLTCHYVHGSNADNLLMLPHRVCQECHTDQRPADHFPGTCWSTNCHVDIHGSNTHPLFFD